MPRKPDNCENIEDGQPANSSNTSVATNTPDNKHVKQQILGIMNNVFQAKSQNIDQISQNSLLNDIDFVSSSDCSISWNDNLNTAEISDVSTAQRGNSFIGKYNALMDLFNAFSESQNEITSDGSPFAQKQIMINFLTKCCDGEFIKLDQTTLVNWQHLLDHLKDPDCSIYSANGAERSEVNTSDAPSRSVSENPPPNNHPDVSCATDSESVVSSDAIPENSMMNDPSCELEVDESEKKL